MVEAPTIWTGESLDQRDVADAAASDVIKACDEMCRVSLWNDGVTTSHLAPRVEGKWVCFLVVTFYHQCH